MGKTLLSVGLDVGTTSTQMILSRLTAENQASSFTVPEIRITNREILYRSPVYFTPLLSQDLVDGVALRHLVEKEYETAGICREDVDTGAVIITGETSRKENARTILESLSDFAGDFVVATAGPDLESVLAARGAGAVERSQGQRILHMDIGGGTSNLCLLEDGQILATGCLNVGGRLLKLDEKGTVTYRSSVLDGLTCLQVGDCPGGAQIKALAQTLTEVLEMAAGLRPADEKLCKLMTKEAGMPWKIPVGVVPSFSGGVADCIKTDYPDLEFGDIGPALGRAIRESRLCQVPHFLGTETIRATVIGAGCHSVQLSGSTVFYQNVAFPLKNIPVAVVEDPQTSQEIQRALQTLDDDGFLAIYGRVIPDYGKIRELARLIVEGFERRPIRVCLYADFAKALGQCIRLLIPETASCLCMDGLSVTAGSYLDVGEPVGPALPVVIKTLVLSGGNQ